MKPQHWTRADIVVEIISPSTAYYDRKTKSDTYRAMGVREMWLVDLETKEVEVRSFEAGKSAVYKNGDTLRSEVLPKIEIPVTALFSSVITSLQCAASILLHQYRPPQTYPLPFSRLSTPYIKERASV